MNDEIETLMMSLRGEFGWVLGFTAWVTVLRIVFTFFNTKLREFAEQNIAEAGAIQRVFDSLPYRVLAFVINMVASIKLPTTGRKLPPSDPPATHPMDRPQIP